MDRPTIVTGVGAQAVQFENRRLASSCGHVPIRGETAHAIVSRRPRNSVVDVDVVVVGKIWVEGDSLQPAFAVGVHRDRDERCWQQRPVFDDPELPVLQANKDPPIGCQLHRCRDTNRGERTPDLGRDEVRWQGWRSWGRGWAWGWTGLYRSEARITQSRSVNVPVACWIKHLRGLAGLGHVDRIRYRCRSNQKKGENSDDNGYQRGRNQGQPAPTCNNLFGRRLF